MTSGRSAPRRCFTRANAAWTRSTRSRSSVSGRIRSCGVCAQAKAPTSIGGLLPAKFVVRLAYRSVADDEGDVRYLVIVSRERPDLLAELTRRFAGDPAV